MYWARAGSRTAGRTDRPTLDLLASFGWDLLEAVFGDRPWWELEECVPNGALFTRPPLDRALYHHPFTTAPGATPLVTEFDAFYILTTILSDFGVQTMIRSNLSAPDTAVQLAGGSRVRKTHSLLFVHLTYL